MRLRDAVPLVVGLLAASCNGLPGDRSGSGRDVAVPDLPDSVWVELTGPALVGFFPPLTQQQVESDGELDTVLDDFDFHLAAATDSLVAQGYTVTARFADTLWIRAADRAAPFVPDSSGVGYYFARPGCTPFIRYRVTTYIELIELGREYLGAPCRPD